MSNETEERQSLEQLERQVGGSWVTWAGAGLLLLALGYFLKFAFDRHWLSPLVRVLFGTGAGCLLYGIGHGMTRKGVRPLYGITLLGFGIAALYTSIGSAYFALDLLQPALGLLLMTGITALAVWTGWHHDSEALAALALLGALVAPTLYPSVDQFVVQRFVYVYAVAIGAIALSVLRPWAWIRALAWAGAQVIFAGYLAVVVTGGTTWTVPFGIITGLFILFALGLAFESLWTRNRNSWWSLALSLGNAVSYALYTTYLIPRGSQLLPITLLLCAAFYGLLALVIRERVPEDRAGAMLHLLAAAALVTMVPPLRLHEVGITVAWGLEALALWLLGARWQNRAIQWSGPLLWMVTTIYWFVVCWDVPWPHWFGVTYVPFINPGALAWVLLAVAGFSFSVWLERMQAENRFYGDLSTLFALAAHVIVGGLLTVQINNSFEAYPLANPSLTYHVNMAALSVSWGVYALLLVAWGMYRKTALFRWFGLAATGVVLGKVILLDLSGLDTLYKMIALACIGVTFVGIGFLYQRNHNRLPAQ